MEILFNIDMNTLLHVIRSKWQTLQNWGGGIPNLFFGTNSEKVKCVCMYVHTYICMHT